MCQGRSTLELEALKNIAKDYYNTNWVYDNGKEVAIEYLERGEVMIDLHGWDSVDEKWVFLQTFFRKDYDLAEKIRILLT